MTLRIGLCSLDHLHAMSYLACLAEVPDVDLVGIWDDDKELREATAQRFGTQAYTSLQDLLDRNLDGVIVCSANARHREHVEAAAPHVAHILCEKPIATSAADGQTMIDVCQAAGAKLQIAFPVRFAPAVAEAKRMLDANRLGRVYSAACTNQGFNPGRWFVDREQSGGGAVIDHTVHVIDLLRWFWDTEVVEVYAEIGHSCFRPDLDIDDAGLLSFRLANGVYGTLDTSWSRPEGHHSWGNVILELVGSEGVLSVDAFRPHLDVTAGTPRRSYWHPWGRSPDHGLIDDFADMIRTGREPSISGHDGLQALRVALAAYESAQTGQPVALDHG